MYVDSIKLINFRNYTNIEVKLNQKLNLFIGNNAQGKTNLLESIYLCSMGKSFRTNVDKELINLVKDKAYVGLDIVNDGLNKKVEIKLERNKGKKARINQVEVEKISDLYGVFNVVIFSPEDLKLVKEGPSQRRQFLDNEISQISPRYRYELNRYNKILNQRNNLLKILQYDKNKRKLLEIWDSQLVEIGTSILQKRLKFINQLSIISKDIHRKITGNIEEIELEYVSSFDISEIDESEIKYKFLNTLKDNVDYEIERGATKFGPHRDDIKISVNEIDIRTFGSQGQQRTSALSLKLAEIELIKQEVGEYPVLLLDDVLSELDQSRRKFLLSTFKDIQTIITSTDDINIEDFVKLTKYVFHIKQGRVINTY